MDFLFLSQSLWKISYHHNPPTLILHCKCHFPLCNSIHLAEHVFERFRATCIDQDKMEIKKVGKNIVLSGSSIKQMLSPGDYVTQELFQEPLFDELYLENKRRQFWFCCHMGNVYLYNLCAISLSLLMC